MITVFYLIRCRSILPSLCYNVCLQKHSLETKIARKKNLKWDNGLKHTLGLDFVKH